MTVELSELSLHLGDFMQKVRTGETVVVSDQGQNIAEIRPAAPLGPRPFGIDKGKFEVTDAFFEPLPDDLLRAFNGEDSGVDPEPPEPK